MYINNLIQSSTDFKLSMPVTTFLSQAFLMQP